jgi:hypothetical protein
MTSICIPSSVKILSKQCFSSCVALSMVNFEIGSKLTEIGDSAFGNCSHLAAIEVPADVVCVGANALPRVNSMKISIDHGNGHFAVIGDFFTDLAGVSLLQYLGSAMAVAIPSLLQTLGPFCFNGCSNLQHVIVETGCRLSRMERSAFEDCTKLSSVCIPSSVETLCEKSFMGCESLSVLTFESDSKLSRIERYAFGACIRLRSVCIPS